MISVYLANTWLRTLGTPTPFSVSDVYVGLIKDDGTEVDASEYERQLVTFSEPSEGALTNASEIEFPSAETDWGAIVGIQLYDALQDGNKLQGGDSVNLTTVLVGTTLRIGEGTITVRVRGDNFPDIWVTPTFDAIPSLRATLEIEDRFSPEDVAAWYAADFENTVFSDVTGDTIASENDVVRRWASIINTGAADGRRDDVGITKTILNDKPALLFDGGMLQCFNLDIVNNIPGITMVTIHHGTSLPHSGDMWAASTTNSGNVKATTFRSTFNGDNKGVGGRRLDGDAFSGARSYDTIENNVSHVQIGTMDFLSGAIELWVDDTTGPVATDTLASSGGNSSANDSANVWIGTKHGQTGSRFFGYFHEIIIFQRVLTTEEIEEIMLHARDYWGVDVNIEEDTAFNEGFSEGFS